MIFTILTLIGVRIKSFNKYGGALKIVLSKCIIIAKKMGFFFSAFLQDSSTLGIFANTRNLASV